MTLVINIIAGPGCGKTTLASLLFSKIKIMGHNIEFVQEFAKTLVWKEEYEILNNQHYVSQSQYKLLKAMDRKVDFIITDGSLLHGLYYNKFNDNNMSNIEKTDKAITNWFNEFDNKVIFLERGDFKYETAGRIQSEEESKQIDIELENILKEKGIKYIKVKSNVENIKTILNYIF